MALPTILPQLWRNSTVFASLSRQIAACQPLATQGLGSASQVMSCSSMPMIGCSRTPWNLVWPARLRALIAPLSTVDIVVFMRTGLLKVRIASMTLALVLIWRFYEEIS